MKKQTPTTSPLMTNLDRLIREGALGEARQILLDINLRKIPREQAPGLADLGRRLNVPKLMLQILKPIVRSERPISPSPTAREVALYATALSRLGSFGEAEKLLNDLNSKGFPEILLFQAQNQMLQWNYTRPIPYLKKYIRTKEITDYERLVGLVNLAASHIWNMQWKQGEVVVAAIQKEVLKQPRLENYKLIHGYSYELLAEMSILKGDLIPAQEWLNSAREHLSGSRSRYEFFVKKWQAILDLLTDTKNPKFLNELLHLKSEAVILKDWETHRDCEFYEALATRNDQLFLKVYFGTRYEKFRSRISQIYKPTFKYPTEFQWTLQSDDSSTPVRIFNMQTASEEGGKPLLASKPLLYKLIKILTEDFFRPTPVGALVAELYPEEYFNPISSPQKAYKAVIRLRDWFEKNNIPLDILVENENYQLIANGPYSIRVYIESTKVAPPKKSSELDELYQQMDHRPFSASDAADILKMTSRTVQRFLEKLVTDRKIVKTAHGRSTRYRFLKLGR